MLSLSLEKKADYVRGLTIEKLKGDNPEFNENPSIENFVSKIVRHQEELFSYKSFKEKQQ